MRIKTRPGPQHGSGSCGLDILFPALEVDGSGIRIVPKLNVWPIISQPSSPNLAIALAAIQD